MAIHCCDWVGSAPRASCHLSAMLTCPGGLWCPVAPGPREAGVPSSLSPLIASHSSSRPGLPPSGLSWRGLGRALCPVSRRLGSPPWTQTPSPGQSEEGGGLRPAQPLPAEGSDAGALAMASSTQEGQLPGWSLGAAAAQPGAWSWPREARRAGPRLRGPAPSSQRWGSQHIGAQRAPGQPRTHLAPAFTPQSAGGQGTSRCSCPSLRPTRSPLWTESRGGWPCPGALARRLSGPQPWMTSMGRLVGCGA